MCRHCSNLLALGIGLSLTAAALAQPPGGPNNLIPDPGLIFTQLDRNGDGQLMSSELPPLLPPPIQAALRTADKNGDGAISRDEFLSSFPNRPNGPPGANGLANGNGPPGLNGPAGGGRPGAGPFGNAAPEPPAPMKTTEMDKIFRLLDTNHDGKLASDEVPPEHRDSIDKLLAEADKNKDGALSKIEFRDGLKRLPELGPQLGESDPKLMFQLMDVNRDKQLTADEIPTTLRPLFERLLAAGDKNGDGALSRQEFGKASSQSQPKSAAAAHKPAAKKKSAEAADQPVDTSR